MPKISSANVKSQDSGEFLPAHQSLTTQMVLSIFGDSVERGERDITDTSEDRIVYKKSVQFLVLKDLGLPALRALDAIYYLISLDPGKPKYAFDLGLFCWLSRTNPRSSTHFRSVMNEVQNAKIQVLDLDYTEDNVLLLADGGKQKTSNDSGVTRINDYLSVGCVTTVGVRKGKLYVEIHRLIHKELLDPTDFRIQNLRLSASIDKRHARCLLEEIIIFESVGETGYVPIDQVRAWMNLTGKKTAEDYRYFNREYLTPALDDINKAAKRFTVEAVPRRKPGSKEVIAINFVYTRKESDSEAAEREAVAASVELYAALRDEYGFTSKEMQQLMTDRDKYTDEYLLTAVDIVRWRQATNAIKKTASGYLRTLIFDGYTLPKADRTLMEKWKDRNKPVQPSVTLQAVREDHDTQAQLALADFYSEAKEGVAWFGTMEQADRERLITVFKKQPTAKALAAVTKVKVSDFTEEFLLSDQGAGKFGVFLLQQKKALGE